MSTHDEHTVRDLPASLAIEETADGKRLSWSLRVGETYVCAIIVAMFNVVLIAALIEPAGEEPIGLVVLGLFVAMLDHWCLSELVNRVTIEVSPHRLSIEQGPIRRHAPIELAARDVHWLEVVRTGRKRRATWQLSARLADGETRTLILNLRSAAWGSILARMLAEELRL